MPPGVGPRPVPGPGRSVSSASVAMPPTMLMRSGVPQQQQQPGVPTPGPQQHPPQTPQLGQQPASPQKDTWTNLFFEFTTLPLPDQTAIMSAAGFPDRQPTSLSNEADKVR